MKIAQKIVAQYKAYDAANVAKVMAMKIDQVWAGAGYTKYTFGDNSVLIQSGPAQYALDVDSVDSIKGYSAWLGNDAWIHANEIDRLLANIG